MLSKKILFKVDGKSLKTEQGDSILKACYTAYIDIPRFCYHEGLRIAGNCRMCLVEVANSRKLIASCATPLLSSFSIFTKTFRVKRARQAVLEFLLINHPLDCPICDQGGECDLQDITLIFGGDRGRFYEFSKRAVFDKNLGPLIKTVMNRCIHCTRCVRFFQETSYQITDRLGLLGRGSSTEIGTYIPNFMLSEMSGNVIDLCPVGALTSKPFAFKARSWELFSQYTYDIVDCLMPRVRFDLVGKNILRVLPYMGVYQSGWINNRTRFCYDSLNMQRQEVCLWNFSEKLVNFYTQNSSLSQYNKDIYVNITWEDAFSLFFKSFLIKMQSQIKSVASSILSLEYAWLIKQFFTSFGIQNMVFENFVNIENDVDFRRTFMFDFPLELFDKNLWYVFLLNVNLRMEAPLIFLHFKKLKTKGFLNIFYSGSNFLNKENTYDVQNDISLHTFLKVLEGRSYNVRLFLKRLLFIKILVITNIEMTFTPYFKYFVVLFDNFFFLIDKKLTLPMNHINVSNINSFVPFLNGSSCAFTVLQRYTGLISCSEIGLFKNQISKTLQILSKDNNKKKSKNLNIFFDTSFIAHKQFSFRNQLDGCFNVLFNATTLDISNLNGFFNLLLPVKTSYEVETTYIDIFLKKKTSEIILSIESTRKELKNVILALSVFMKMALKTSWIGFLFSTLSVNMTLNNLDFIFGHIICGSSNGAFFHDDFQFNIIFLFWKNWFFFRSTFVFFFNDKFFFLPKQKIVNVVSTINFYEENRINTVNFSKSMKQSSICYEKSNLNLSFRLSK